VRDRRGFAVTLAVTEHVFRIERHETFYLACGPADGPLMIFVHGWPALSIMWREQLAHFGALGYRCVAPDMRGYGRSSVPPRAEDYALEHIAGDMLELLRGLGAHSAIWVGHDWGGPVVWALASQHPEACRGVVALCVPYIAQGFVPANLLPLVDRSVYPQEKYPAGQWDYQLFYQDHLDAATAAFEADVRATIKALYRSASAKDKGKPALTARIRRDGGWFGGLGRAPDLPRDPAVLSEDDLERYAAAFTATGFFGADAWYVNPDANARYAARARDGGVLRMPVLFVHAAYDAICETVDSRLAEPMRRDCTSLTERVVDAGHWLVHEKPADVNAAIEDWLRGTPALRDEPPQT
jgi:pimeloyl-ACP methyl ester carboxylesterase